MRVRELIEKLQEYDPEIYVDVYGGYDIEYGDKWDSPKEFYTDSIGWDAENQCRIEILFIS